jgi:hypothetical protein
LKITINRVIARFTKKSRQIGVDSSGFSFVTKDREGRDRVVIGRVYICYESYLHKALSIHSLFFQALFSDSLIFLSTSFCASSEGFARSDSGIHHSSYDQKYFQSGHSQIFLFFLTAGNAQHC